MFLKPGSLASQGLNELKLRIAGVMFMPKAASWGRLVGLVEARGEVDLVTWRNYSMSFYGFCWYK